MWAAQSSSHWDGVVALLVEAFDKVDRDGPALQAAALEFNSLLEVGLHSL